MREILLANGRGVARVDDKHYARLSCYAWYLIVNGYAVCSVGSGPTKRQIMMHRLVLGLDDDDPRDVDHDDGDKLNNQEYNLRPATRSQNIANIGRRPNGSSQYKGVSWRESRQTWRARIKVGYQELSLGHFKVERDAALAYDAAAVLHFGEFALTNRKLGLL
jgi:hypothetical protein